MHKAKNHRATDWLLKGILLSIFNGAGISQKFDESRILKIHFNIYRSWDIKILKGSKQKWSDRRWARGGWNRRQENPTVYGWRQSVHNEWCHKFLCVSLAAWDDRDVKLDLITFHMFLSPLFEVFLWNLSAPVLLQCNTQHVVNDLYEIVLCSILWCSRIRE